MDRSGRRHDRALSPDGGDAVVVANTGGRPLGLAVARDGRLLVCDSHRGLLALDPTRAARSTSWSTTSTAGRSGSARTSTNLPTAQFISPSPPARASATSTSRAVPRGSRRAAAYSGAPPTAPSPRWPTGLYFANGVTVDRGRVRPGVRRDHGRTAVEVLADGPAAGTVTPLADRTARACRTTSRRASDGRIWVAMVSAGQRRRRVADTEGAVDLRKLLWRLARPAAAEDRAAGLGGRASTPTTATRWPACGPRIPRSVRRHRRRRVGGPALDGRPSAFPPSRTSTCSRGAPRDDHLASSNSHSCNSVATGKSPRDLLIFSHDGDLRTHGSRAAPRRCAGRCSTALDRSRADRHARRAGRSRRAAGCERCPVPGRDAARRRLLRGAGGRRSARYRCRCRPSPSAVTRCRAAASSPLRTPRRCPTTSQPMHGWSPTSTAVTSSPREDPHGRHRPASIIKVLRRDAVAAGSADQQAGHRHLRTTRTPRAPGSASTTAASTPSTICCTACSCTRATTPPTLSPMQLGGMDAAIQKINDLAGKLGGRDTRAATPSGLDGPGHEHLGLRPRAVLPVRLAERRPSPTSSSTKTFDFPGHPARVAATTTPAISSRTTTSCSTTTRAR